MAEKAPEKQPAPVDSVHVKFPTQYRHLMPNQVYYMTFGEVFTFRNDNPVCPKPEPQGGNKDAYLAYEKATLAKQKR